jgi:hypothetical protein
MILKKNRDNEYILNRYEERKTYRVIGISLTDSGKILRTIRNCILNPSRSSKKKTVK